jgi:hypothetical protein
MIFRKYFDKIINLLILKTKQKNSINLMQKIWSPNRSSLKFTKIFGGAIATPVPLLVKSVVQCFLCIAFELKVNERILTMFLISFQQ